MYIGFFNHEVNYAIATAIEAQKSNSPKAQEIINNCKSTVIALWSKEGRTKENINDMLKSYTLLEKQINKKD